MLDQAKQDGDDVAGAPGVSMHTDTAMDYIDAQPRLFRGGACYTTVPAINVVAEKHYAWALPIAAGHRDEPERRPVGLPRLRQRRLQVAVSRTATSRWRSRIPEVSRRRVHLHGDPRGEPLPRPRAPARLDRCDPERRRLAALLRRLHVGVQLDGVADDVLPHGARLLDPRPGEHRPRARGLLPQVGRPGALARAARRTPSRGVTQVGLLPANAARLRQEAIDNSKRAETLFARFDFVNATFAAQKAWRSAAAYRDLALGLAPGTSELQKGTKKEGASACPSATGLGNRQDAAGRVSSWGPTRHFALYRIPFSTNVERVALALAHKGHRRSSGSRSIRPTGARSCASAARSSCPCSSTATASSPTRRRSSSTSRSASRSRRSTRPIRRAAPSCGPSSTGSTSVWKRPPNLIVAEEAKAEPDRDADRRARAADRRRAAALRGSARRPRLPLRRRALRRRRRRVPVPQVRGALGGRRPGPLPRGAPRDAAARRPLSAPRGLDPPDRRAAAA